MENMEEPKVEFCTIRGAIDEWGEPENHLECRFSDGQKFAAIIIDGNFEKLARCMCDFLNSEQYKNATA
jgi:hypothetical protein